MHLTKLSKNRASGFGRADIIAEAYGVFGAGMSFDRKRDSLYATYGKSLYIVSTEDGEVTYVGPTGLDLTPVVGLAHDDCEGVLYANYGKLTGMTEREPAIQRDMRDERVQTSLYTLDKEKGTATLVGTNGVENIEGLAWKGDC